MTCQACQSPLKLAEDPRVYRCTNPACGQLYTLAAMPAPDNFEFTGKPVPRTVDDLKRLK